MNYISSQECLKKRELKNKEKNLKKKKRKLFNNNTNTDDEEIIYYSSDCESNNTTDENSDSDYNPYEDIIENSEVEEYNFLYEDEEKNSNTQSQDFIDSNEENQDKESEYFPTDYEDEKEYLDDMSVCDYSNKISSNIENKKLEIETQENEKELNQETEKKDELIVFDFSEELMKKITNKYEEILKKEEEKEDEIIQQLNEKDRKKLEKVNDDIKLFNKTQMPNKIQFLLSDNIDISTKALYMSKLDTLKMLEPGLNEHKKTKDWVEALESIPFGVYNNLPCEKSDIPKFLKNIKNTLDDAVYGHKQVKETFMEIITKWITNNDSKGNIIGLVGSPGTGKTSIVREGLSKALNRPFCSLSLSGLNDENYLCGFAPTYEGSTYGKMVKMLIDAKCMNPIIFMDELDKIDNTRNGNNIANKLIEITDTSQNHDFEDFYLSGVKIDLSKCLFIFSMNNLEDINPILKDRIEIIKVNGFNNNEKKTICKKYIIPKELKEIGLKENDIIFTDEIIDHIVSKIPKEDGVRTLKKTLQKIIRKINLIRFLNNHNDLSYYIKNVKLPYKITVNDIDNFMKTSTKKEQFLNMYC